jgi:hypothetical protein
MSAVPWSIRGPSDIGDGSGPRWRKRIGGTDDGVGGPPARHPGRRGETAAVLRVRVSRRAAGCGIRRASCGRRPGRGGDRLAANRGGLPSVARNRLGAVERMGDLAIARVGEMAVERADHHDEPPAMPPREEPRFRRRTRRAAGETPLKADQAEDAKPEIFVQWQQRGEPLAFLRLAKPHAMVARGVLDEDLNAVRIKNARSGWCEIAFAQLMRL